MGRRSLASESDTECFIPLLLVYLFHSSLLHADMENVMLFVSFMRNMSVRNSNSDNCYCKSHYYL